jgi:hypothetical protein
VGKKGAGDVKMIRKIILDSEGAETVYSPKLADLHLFSSEKKEHRKENRRIFENALSYYNRGWYRKAKEELQLLDEHTASSAAFQDSLLRVYRKLAARLAEKGQYKEALTEMLEMFERCPNTTNSDIRKFNKLVETLERKEPLLDVQYKQVKKHEPEFNVKTSSLPCIATIKKTSTFKHPDSHAIDTVKVQTVCHFLPSSLPQISLEKDGPGSIYLRYTQPENGRIGVGLERIKAAENGAAFIAASAELDVSVYDRHLQPLLRCGIAKYTRDVREIRCLDLAPDLSAFLFTIQDRLFLFDASGPEPQLLFYWTASEDRDSAVGYMFGGRMRTRNQSLRITGTGFSADGKRFYAGCSDGSVFRLDRRGRIDYIYILPPKLRYYHAGRISIKHILPLQDYLHIAAEKEILVIREDRLLKIINIMEGEVKWFARGFVHIVGKTVYVYSRSGDLLEVLQFNSKVKHIAFDPGALNGCLLIDADEKAHAFAFPPHETAEPGHEERLDRVDGEEFRPVLASGIKTILQDIQAVEALLTGEQPQKKQAKENYKKIEKQVDYYDDHLALARSVSLYLRDTKWAEAIYRKIEGLCHGPGCYTALAEAVLEHLDDRKKRKWARGLYKKAEENLRFTGESIHLAASLARCLKDRKWAADVYEQAEVMAVTMEHFEALAASVMTHLKDRPFVRRVLAAAGERVIPSAYGLIKLAGLVARYALDPEDPARLEWLKTLYLQAAEMSNSEHRFRALAGSLSLHMPDKNFTAHLLSSFLETRHTAMEYKIYTRIISEVLDEPALAETAEKEAGMIFMTVEELDRRFDTLLEQLEELHGRRKIGHIKAFLSKYAACKHIKDIYFRAMPLVLPLEKMETLYAYIHYFNLSMLHSTGIKPLPAKIKREIFRSEDRYINFMTLLESLDPEQDLDAVFLKVKQFFIPEKKNIRLDREKIAHIKTQHAVTVQKLAKILSGPEEKRAEPAAAPVVESPSSLEHIFASPTPREQPTSVSGVPFNADQKAFLELILRYNRPLPDLEAVRFAQSRKLFKNQLVDGINQLFYDYFEDVLVEESRDGFVINPDYIDDLRLKRF